MEIDGNLFLDGFQYKRIIFGDGFTGVVEKPACFSLDSGVIKRGGVRCDGVDDDCSGAVDEDFTDSATACGVGACTAVGVTSASK